MKETVLLFHFEKERVGKIRSALLPLRIRVKTVEPEKYGQNIGFLAGNKEILPQQEESDPDRTGFRKGNEEAGRTEIEQEMMVMAWLTGHQVDQVLTELRKQGIGRIDYKAVVTQQNQYWDCRTLYAELKKEHEAFTGKS